MTDITEDWAKAYDLPDPGNMMEHHDRREEVFVKQGTLMARAIRDAIETYTGKPIKRSKILDFGCGVGRVTQALGEPRQVGTFAGALAAFQRDKTPAHGRGSGLER